MHQFGVIYHLRSRALDLIRLIFWRRFNWVDLFENFNKVKVAIKFDAKNDFAIFYSYFSSKLDMSLVIKNLSIYDFGSQVKNLLLVYVEEEKGCRSKKAI